MLRSLWNRTRWGMENIQAVGVWCLFWMVVLALSIVLLAYHPTIAGLISELIEATAGVSIRGYWPNLFWLSFFYCLLPTIDPLFSSEEIRRQWKNQGTEP